MFFINTNNEIPIKRIAPSSFLVLPSNSNPVPAFVIQDKPKDKTIFAKLNKEVVTLDIGTNDDITSIDIDGKLYTRVYSTNDLVPGSYYVDLISGKVHLKSEKLTSFKVQINITLNTQKLLHTQIPDIPDCLKKLIIKGTINISRQIEGHPSANLQAVCEWERANELRELFKDTTKKWIFYNIPFRVSRGGYTETVHKIHEYPYGLHGFSVSFEGWWLKYLEEKIKFVGLATSDDYIECYTRRLAEKKILEAVNKKNHSKVEINVLAKQLPGVQIISDSKYYTYFSSDEGSGITTLGTELEKIASENGLIVIYSDPNGIRLEKFTGHNPIDLTSRQEKITELSISRKTDDGELKPTKITWNKIYTPSIYYNKEPEFKQKREAKTQVKLPSEGVDQCPSHITIARDMSMVCDASGERRTQSTKFYEGGVLMREIIEEFGFIYYGYEIKPYIDKNTGKFEFPLASHWQKIKHIETEQMYDAETGYYLGETSRGWYMARFIQETDELETLWLKEELATPGLDRQEKAYLNEKLQAYTFRRVPIYSYEHHQLALHWDFYNDYSIYTDFGKSKFQERFVTWEECDENGLIRRKNKKDPRWVPEFFILTKDKFYSGYAEMQNPENILREPDAKEPPKPPLTTGEENRTIEEVHIMRSKYTDGTYASLRGYNFAGGSKNSEDKYIVRTHTLTAQDDRFKNSIQDTSETEYNGRPPVANRRPSQWITSEEYLATQVDNVYKETVHLPEEKHWLDVWDLYVYKDSDELTKHIKETYTNNNFLQPNTTSGYMPIKGTYNSGMIPTHHILYRPNIEATLAYHSNKAEAWKKLWREVSSGNYTAAVKYRGVTNWSLFPENRIPSGNTWHFDTYDMIDALRMAQRQYEREQFFKGDRYSFGTLFKPLLRENQVIKFNYAFESFQAKIISINHTIRIDGETVDGEHVYEATTHIECLEYPPKISSLDWFKVPQLPTDQGALKGELFVDHDKSGTRLGLPAKPFPYKRRSY